MARSQFGNDYSIFFFVNYKALALWREALELKPNIWNVNFIIEGKVAKN